MGWKLSKEAFDGVLEMARGFLFGRTNGFRLQQLTKLSSPPPPKKKSLNDYLRVSVLIDRDTRMWKGDVVRSLFLPFEARNILNIPLCHSLPED